MSRQAEALVKGFSAYTTHDMTSPQPQIAVRHRFAISDRVIVIRPGADQHLVGVVVLVRLAKSHFTKPRLWYVVEFNGIDRQQYGETDLALAPDRRAA